MLSPNLASILGFFVVTLDSCSRFLTHATFLVETRQSDFTELRPFCKQSEMQYILDSFEKKSRKRINNGFGTKIQIKNIQLFWNNLLASLVIRGFLAKKISQKLELAVIYTHNKMSIHPTCSVPYVVYNFQSEMCDTGQNLFKCSDPKSRRVIFTSLIVKMLL